MKTLTSQTISTSVAPQKKRGRRKLSVLGWIAEILKYVVLIVLSISFLLPFYWMASSALKDSSQIYTVPPIWIPNPAHWNNFWDAWTTYNFNHYTFNTVVRYAIPVTIGTVLSSAIVAYGFARIQWPGRDFLFWICMMTMMVPSQVTTVPLFITFRNLGWINSYRPLTIPAWFGSAFFIFMLRQFFRTIPDELSDAALIDGASELGILFRIILPLSKPALAVVALFTSMGCWNDYYGPLIYVNNAELMPLALGVQAMRTSLAQVGGGTREFAYAYLMAVSTIVTAPIVIAFFLTQRTFIEGISLTGLKG